MEKGPQINGHRSLTCSGRKRGDGKKEDYRQHEKVFSDYHGSERILKEDPDEGPQDSNGRLFLNAVSSFLHLLHRLLGFLDQIVITD